MKALNLILMLLIIFLWESYNLGMKIVPEKICWSLPEFLL
jgi:hypothetical protein